MRVKYYFLAVSLCCMLPFIVQGVELDDDPPSPGPRASLRSISPVIVETESGMLNLYFTKDLGEVYVVLQPVTGKVDYFEVVNTSIQDQAVLAASAGTYILTITDTDGNVILQESVVIP